MIFQASNKIKVMNQSSLKSSSNLLWTYTSFQSFKQAQFFLTVSLEGKIWEKWFCTHDYKKKLRVLTFEPWNPTLITENVFDMNWHAIWLS